MDQLNSESLTADSETSSFGSKSATGGSTLEAIKDSVADKLHAAAGAIQQKTAQNQGYPAAAYAGQAAGWLDNAAEYVREADPQKMKADVKNQIRQNPGRSLLMAGAAGLLLGFLLRR